MWPMCPSDIRHASDVRGCRWRHYYRVHLNILSSTLNWVTCPRRYSPVLNIDDRCPIFLNEKTPDVLQHSKHRQTSLTRLTVHTYRVHSVVHDVPWCPMSPAAGSKASDDFSVLTARTNQAECSTSLPGNSPAWENSSAVTSAIN